MRGTWRTWIRWGTALAVVLAAGIAQAAEPLELGDAVPELDVTGWVQGEELQTTENPDKRVRVVQFFNSYDQGCVKAAPDLEKLQQELGPKGVDLIAVTTQGEDAAREFVEKCDVTYRVAVDQYNNTNAVFMKGIHRLPMAFVIDRDNRVAWIGTPEDGLRRIVDDVLDGTYDVDHAREVARLRNALYATLEERDADAMAAAADALLDADPEDTFARDIRLQVFEMNDDAKGYVGWMRLYTDKAKDDAKTLSWAAWRLVSRGDMAWRDPALAHEVSSRAVELSESKNADILDTHARVLFEVGLLEDAIATVKKSLAIDADANGVSDRLAHYEKCLDVRKTLEKAGKKKRR